MTGFATTSGQMGDFDWRWDVKSVNSRGLDLRFRLPGGYESLDPKLRAAAQKSLKRGAVAISLTVRFQTLQSRTSVDESALSRMVQAVELTRSWLESSGVPVADTQAEAILALPGVLTHDEPGEAADPAKYSDILLAGFEAALVALATERDAEGARLARVISEQVTQIESVARDAEACAEDAVLALRERLKTQLTAVLADTSFSPERMEQEAAVLASKADVREEIDRLHAHVAAARELLDADEPVGRRLEFLTQEFNREANTLCSKSQTERMTRLGLDLKTVIDQIREQAANVE